MKKFDERKVWAEVGSSIAEPFSISLYAVVFFMGAGANLVWGNTLTAWFLFALGAVFQYGAVTSGLEIGINYVDDDYMRK